MNLEILTKTFDDLPVGIGIFHVEDLEDLKSVRYVYMNKIVLYEMRKEREEVFGKRIIEVAQIIHTKYKEKVPDDLDTLIQLTGVGRKTANCVLVYAFEQPAIPVDIHVHRV